MDEIEKLRLEFVIANYVSTLIPQLQFLAELVRMVEVISAESSMDLYAGIIEFLAVLDKVRKREAEKER
jgi:hypothetical protein